MSYSCLSFEVKEGVALLGFGLHSSTSLPILDELTLRELERVVGEVARQQKKQIEGLILFSHNPRAFLAGADIKLISALETESQAVQGAEWGQRIFNDIADLKIPTIACVHGVCLGGGCELALACQQIYASDDPRTQLGLPEVQLGLIPAFGGTYRLPRKIGLAGALGLILTGKKVVAQRAQRMGLVEEVYAREKLVQMALKAMAGGRGRKSVGNGVKRWVDNNFVARKLIFSKAREGVLKKTKGFYQAPLKILDVMEEGQGKSRGPYLNMESQAFGELCLGSQGQNLQHVFFLMDGAKKYSGPKAGGKVAQIAQGGVLGAGAMGGGIAWLLAQNAQRPVMKDISQQALELGLKQSGDNFRQALKRKKITPAQYYRWQSSIAPTLQYQSFGASDLVIEAVPESMQIKQQAFQELEQVVREDCLIVSNTSSLSVTKMAQGLQRPERFCGLHFFNPVHRMPLVEIITHDRVAAETVEALYRWVLAVKKTPLIVKDGPGFLVNRILMPYMNESAHLLAAGVGVQDIERACVNFGMPMGPFRLSDEVGLDVANKVGEIIYRGLGPRLAPAGLVQKMVEAGCLGKKNRRGFYLYDEGGKAVGVNCDVEQFISAKRMSMDETMIQMRIFLPMINEAAYILDEKIVASAREVDLGLIFGIGFPPFRGGLLRYADHEGLDHIASAMTDFAHEVDGERYGVAPYLQHLLEVKQLFYS